VSLPKVYSIGTHEPCVVRCVPGSIKGHDLPPSKVAGSDHIGYYGSSSSFKHKLPRGCLAQSSFKPFSGVIHILASFLKLKLLLEQYRKSGCLCSGNPNHSKSLCVCVFLYSSHSSSSISSSGISHILTLNL
jgi:hypothetical protein